MFKRYSQFAGGTCDPLVIHWPKGMKARGEMRHQYHHSTDIVPTILEAIGLEMPTVYRGVEQYPLNGVSMRYSFDDANAPTTKKRQYFSMLGTRGIWQDGWKAAALHAPISGKGHFDQDRWELYHVDEDRAEARNLADEHPEKLQELIAAWFEEARRISFCRLTIGPPSSRSTTSARQGEPPRSRYIYYPDTSPVPESTAVNIRGRSYKILADVEVTPESEGVIFAHGSRFGGHSLFIRDRKLHYVYNFLGIKPEQVFVSPNCSPAADAGRGVRPGGRRRAHGVAGNRETLRRRRGRGRGPMRADRAVHAVRRRPVRRLRQRRPGEPVLPAELPVHRRAHHRCRVDIGEDQYLDLEKLAAAAFARD